ncbi:hypothetical protein DFR26_2206 [Paraperlucidibaca baekdonensis]|uniref:Uncharacterized protein n=1 Tax=Paraperlucidibaca baekdonensis TaxID=748120 RepID=A0A3E0GZQ9_9GAMM|nr:hypothetical protein [Paraperlucidibaca baekdonensis]REH35873.1 hypothetical protein DFR26_2206 [Paraperlucidibaca baekdonensis]
MSHTYFSQRTGSNPNLEGLPLADVVELFQRVFDQLQQDGFFDEAFGFYCVDEGHISGSVRDVALQMLLKIRKKHLWPISEHASSYTEDDLFDVLEFLYQHVSKPMDGEVHSYSGCGMHWETFSKREGQQFFRERMNDLLSHYNGRFVLSESGEVLRAPEAGFEKMFEADIPSDDSSIRDRIDSAVLRYRRHGSTIDDRRQAVRDLADVLEYLRPQVKKLLTNQDEKDLFNLANNFGIRHHNEKQKTGYDAALWLSWMFYLYLATIHVVLRKIGHDQKAET